MKTIFEKYNLWFGLILVFIVFFGKSMGVSLGTTNIFQNQTHFSKENHIHKSVNSSTKLNVADLTDEISDSFTHEAENEPSLILQTLDILNFIFINSLFLLTYLVYSIYVTIRDSRQILYRNIPVPYL